VLIVYYPIALYQNLMRLSFSSPVQCGSVFATARSLVAHGSMIHSFLCRRLVSILALPNLQSRLVDGASKRQRPREPRHESNIHYIRRADASSPDWPPDKNAIPETAAGTARKRHFTMA